MLKKLLSLLWRRASARHEERAQRYTQQEAQRLAIDPQYREQMQCEASRNVRSETDQATGQSVYDAAYGQASRSAWREARHD